MNKNQIYVVLVDFQDKKIIRSFQIVGNRPGYRYIIEGYGFSTRVYTTKEVTAFINGTTEAWIASSLNIPEYEERT